ncbi:MAG: hypothetical protein IKV75_06025 [Bacteroidales bacterium]|nr:hypothetical protein [Bacteroidales bacterium]
MKSIKDIENISLEGLRDISMDESISVPKSLSKKVSQDISNEIRRRWSIKIAGAAAIVILAVGLSRIKTENEPVDTFDDPYLAYAELEKAFEMVSEGMQKGIGRTVEFLK